MSPEVHAQKDDRQSNRKGMDTKMLFDGCQGNKGVQIQEKTCPVCGSTIELMSSDVFAECEECGTVLYSDYMECIGRCAKAKECVGEAYFQKLMDAKEAWQVQRLVEQDDEW